MPHQYADVRYELLRPGQVKARRDATPIAFIVAGSLEWHGFQNPLGTDSLKAHAICCAAAQKYGGVVLPPFYQGLLGSDNWGAPGWEGFTLSFNEETMFETAMLGIVRALVYGKWQVLVGVTGHDVEPQRDAMQRAIEAGTVGTNATGFAVMEGEMHQITPEVPIYMDHAGAWETSCMMSAYPEYVELDDLRAHLVSTGDMFDIHGPEGIGGYNPLTHASPELGANIITAMADLIGQRARGLLEDCIR
ncbi:MAG: creatininase family protein [Armatimonadota bacterium]